MAKKVERPVGPVVDPLPVGNVPDMRPLHGRWIRLDHVSAAKHAADLYASFDGKDPEGHIWTNLSYGPFTSPEEFTEWIKAREALNVFFLHLDAGEFCNAPHGGLIN